MGDDGNVQGKKGTWLSGGWCLQNVMGLLVLVAGSRSLVLVHLS